MAHLSPEMNEGLHKHFIDTLDPEVPSIPWARVRRAPWSLLAGAFATVLHDHRIGARRLRAWIDQEPHTEVDHTGVIPMITIEQLLFPMYQGLRPNDLDALGWDLAWAHDGQVREGMTALMWMFVSGVDREIPGPAWEEKIATIVHRVRPDKTSRDPRNENNYVRYSHAPYVSINAASEALEAEVNREAILRERHTDASLPKGERKKLIQNAHARNLRAMARAGF